jgi:hypothetical protein
MDRSEYTDPGREFAEIIKSTTPSELPTGPTSNGESEHRGETSLGSVNDNVESSPEDSTYPALATYEDGVLTELRISSSLIKAILNKGESRNPCPKNIYETYLTGNNRRITTAIMNNGMYFESHVLGSGRSGKLFELPKLKKGGRSIDNIRIDEQINNFDLVAHKYGLIIVKEGRSCNTQVEVERLVESLDHPNVVFKITGTIDLISPIDAGIHKYPAAAIDIKLPKDRDNEHGEYSWGLPQYMDHTQGVLYSFLTDFPFFYLIFDYRSKDRGHKLIPVITMAMFPDGETLENRKAYTVARQRQSDLKLSVKEVISTVMRWDYEKYPTHASYDNCKNCPLNPQNGGSCPDYNVIKEI